MMMEEEVPTKRAVRMVVGFSESSLEDEQLSPSIVDPVKPAARQRHASDTSTEPTSSQFFFDHDFTEYSSSSERSAEEDNLSASSGSFSSKKLYGRESHQAELFATYERIMKDRAPRVELDYVLISGGVGTGKQTLASALRRKVKNEGGFFCAGTFERMNQRGPVQPMVDAFAEYVQQVFEQGQEEIDEAQRRIRSMVDEKDLPSLMRILPSLRDLMADDRMEQNVSDTTEEEVGSPCPCDKSPETRGHSHFAMMKLMRAISRPERPVVMMLSNLQWAGVCTFEFLKSLVLDDMNDSFMFLGLTRDDVPRDSPVSNFLRKIEDQSVRITNIELQNLEPDDVQEMVSDSFLMPQEQSTSLADFLYDCSSGNPFFIDHCIYTIKHEPRFLNYDKEKNSWSINSDVAGNYISTCPIDLMTKKFETYPREQKKVLMVVACLGSHSTQRMIEAALQEDVTSPLKILVKKGKLTRDKKDGTYTIGSNALKAAAYNLIDQELKPAFHLEIGLRLMRTLCHEELDDRLFCVVMQLQNGLSLIPDQATKYKVAALFVRAAEKAALTFSFQASLRALNTAYDLLGPNHWEDAYELTIVIYNYLAEMQFQLNDNERVDKLLDDIDKNGREQCTHTLQAYVTQVHVLGVRGQPGAAIDKGMAILSSLGVHLPTKPRKLSLIWSLSKLGREVKRKSSEMLRRLPRMTDPQKLTAMQVLNLLFLDTFLHRRELWPFVVLKMMKLSLESGLSAISSVAFAGYGALLCIVGRGEEGQRFGKIALDLVELFDANSFRSRCIGLVYGCILPAVQPWRNSIDHLREGHRLGLMTGDIEFAMFNANLAIAFMLDDGGYKYDDLMSQLKEFVDLTEAHGQSHHLHSLILPTMSILQIYNDPNGDIVDGRGGPMKDCLKDALESGNGLSICMMYSCRAFFLFSAGEYRKSLKVLEEKKALIPTMNGSIFDAFTLYLEGLSCFSCARLEQRIKTRTMLIQQGKKVMKSLQKLSLQNPDSCMGKVILLEAEYAALSRKTSLAKQKYSQAIALSVGHGNSFEAVFSKQLAGIYYCLELRDMQTGMKYLTDAIDSLKAWGGHAASEVWEQKVEVIKEKAAY
eukprot:CAMPEP_0178860114 /NCGR_PEP_ID=MMETSP0747-20121128/1570_1 /TAXON_ID=913974 /ORGANISM="Nitzschia punctata, Strain CCMP561" /LENGTH=1094 /DNA_ID=CAMNT_0020526545 /DNA_START=320 /DNA_END=3604 /DNA_ORIENTATION=-